MQSAERYETSRGWDDGKGRTRGSGGESPGDGGMGGSGCAARHGTKCARQHDEEEFAALNGGGVEAEVKVEAAETEGASALESAVEASGAGRRGGPSRLLKVI